MEPIPLLVVSVQIVFAIFAMLSYGMACRRFNKDELQHAICDVLEGQFWLLWMIILQLIKR